MYQGGTSNLLKLISAMPNCTTNKAFEFLQLFFLTYIFFTTNRCTTTDTVTDKLHLINASLFTLAPGKGLCTIGDNTGMLFDKISVIHPA